MKCAGPVLEAPRGEGYPTAYLVSRLRARRALLIDDWAAFIIERRPALPARYAGVYAERPQDAVWRAMRREFAWVHAQMETAMRGDFFPFYVLFELNTIFACLRYRASKDAGERIRRLLEFSLLSRGLKSAILSAADAGQGVRAVEAAFCSLSEQYRGLAAEFGKAGLRGAEQVLRDAFLKRSAGYTKSPVIRLYLSAAIDLGNILAAYKRLRWGMTGPFRFVEGGGIGIRALGGAADPGALMDLARKLTGRYPARPEDIEKTFIGWVLGLTRSASRLQEADAVILDYLIRVYAEARNLSLVLSSGALEAGLLREEVLG